jgi:hypothetical protein
VVGIVWICGLTGCASLDTSNSFVARWGMRGAGALGSFVLHEACHLAVGAALGADVNASFRGSSLYLEFSDLSANEHRAVAIVGNACTGLAAEVIVDTGSHRNSHFAWGAAAFHAVNSFGYAWSASGDSEYWKSSGGSRTTWQAMNATHSTRIGAQLAWDSDFGDYLKRRWRIGPAIPPPVFDLADSQSVFDDDMNLLTEPPASGTDLVLHSFEPFGVPGSLNEATD